MGKSAGPTPAKQPKPNPPAPVAPQEVAQAPPVAAEGMEVVTDGTSTVQPCVEQGGASGGSSQPTPSIPPLIQTPNPPNPGIQNQGAGANWYSGAPPLGSRGLPRGHNIYVSCMGSAWACHEQTRCL